jgi:hypothetical protein
MLPVMSVISSFPHTMMADDWSMMSVMAGLSAAPVRHAIDLARLFPGDAPEWPDAMLFETRRHLAGCLSAMEIGLRQALELNASIAPVLRALPEPVVWPGICARPALVAPSLLGHMRLRGGISLLLRQYGRADEDADELADRLDLTASADSAISQAAIALNLAEGRWSMTGMEGQPIRPDLPADQFVDLLWTAAAPLCAALLRTGLMPTDSILAAVEGAGRSMLADHDEGQGAIALADRLVRLLGERADAPSLLGAALAQRRHLLFAALAARRLRIDTIILIDVMLAEPIEQVAAVCHALGGSAPDYRHLLLALRPVRVALNDAVIVREAERYDAMSEGEADAIVAGLRAPSSLRRGLALIDMPGRA